MFYLRPPEIEGSLHVISAFEKEFLITISAYNLVRALMCLAARRAGLQPRQLSFSFVLDGQCRWPRLLAATSRAQHDAELERVLDYAAGYKIPQRRRLRTFPRAV